MQKNVPGRDKFIYCIKYSGCVDAHFAHLININ